MGGSGAGVSNAYNHVLFTENMKVYSDSKVSALLRDVTVDQRIRFLNSRENYTHPLKKTAAEKEKCNTKRAEAVGVTASARKEGVVYRVYCAISAMALTAAVRPKNTAEPIAMPQQGYSVAKRPVKATSPAA